jgi:hypothetical protein
LLAAFAVFPALVWASFNKKNQRKSHMTHLKTNTLNAANAAAGV